jgi:hypothetical protein
MQNGMLLSHNITSLESIESLDKVEFKVFSQWGEDGIIDWLVEKIPNISNTFIEFGVENYNESNTRFLLQKRGWSGLVIDGSKENVDSIKSQEIYWRHNLTAKHAFIDCENINNLINESGYQGEIGLLSIDIDGNDYWVWDSINSISPAIVVCEYNALFGDIYSFTTPYRPDFHRTSAHHSNLYFGASIQAMISLGKQKGYTFVGTNSTGVNAFFIRNDLAPHILDRISNILLFNSQHREARDEQGKLIYLGGSDRYKLIEDLPLVDLEKNIHTQLRKYKDFYSLEWASNNRVAMHTD